MMYDRDQIILERLRNERIAQIDKEKRTIEPDSRPGSVDVQGRRIQGVDEDYYDPREKRRQQARKYEEEKREQL